jgi:hypothetical protein
MKQIRTVLLCSILSMLAFTPQLKAQTVDEIIAKHLQAVGGKEKLASIKTLYIEATAVTQNGMEISTKTWKVKDKLYRQEISFGMGNVVMIVTPTKGWASNPRSGGEFKPIPDEQLKMMQYQLEPGGPFVDYAAKGGKLELVGKDTVGGKECYKVKLTPGNGPEVTYSIDEQSFYVLRESRKGGGMMGGGGGGNGGGGNPSGDGRGGGGRRPGDGTMSIEFTDYQKTADGFVFPNTLIMGGFGAKSSVEKVEVNKPVDEAALSKPSN